MDDQQRLHIQDDLKGFMKGELLFDTVSRALYSTDASILQIQPAGVVVPRDEEDLQLLVRYAAENQVPLVPRGAGSGVAGESLGSGLIVDLSQHFRQIKEFTENCVRVQCGVTCRALNDFLAGHGRRFAPDTASAVQSTIGGMLATNASGARVIRHGYTRDHVHRLRLILDTGDVAEVGRESIRPEEQVGEGHLQDILSATAVLLEQNRELIRQDRPRTPFNRCGYLLDGVLEGETLDLPRLLVGSEGTLALFPEAVLRTIPLPGGRAVVLLGYGSLEEALHAVQIILPTKPSACELIDRRLLSLARGSQNSSIAPTIPANLEAVLLVEYEEETAEEARWAASRLPYLLTRGQLAPTHSRTAWQAQEMEELWHLRDQVLPSLYGLRAGAEPLAVIEDVGVPPQDLGRYLHQVQDILQTHETTASFLVHAGSGQVHARPFLDLRNPEERARLKSISEQVHALTLAMGGTVSTQHGTGLLRTPWVSRQYPRIYPVFRQLKSIFDPNNIFNPGKIVTSGADYSHWPLRLKPEPDAKAETLLVWDSNPLVDETLKCNGCGHCRSDMSGQRMCPIFHATHSESASPRAKANLLRFLFSTHEDSLALSADEVRDVADLCVNCKMCAQECPAHVNIPKLMLEAKAANVAEHGLDRMNWFFSRSERWARWGSSFAWVVNHLLGSKTVRWWLEKGVGLSKERRLPRFAARSFMQQAHRRGLTRKPPASKLQVAYFVDTYANYNDPTIAEAVVKVLQHNGIEVYVPPGQRGCGMAPLVHGDLESARDSAEQNVRILAEIARQGHLILCSEPTAALMIRQEYQTILADDDVKLVAAHTREITAYLWQLHQQGRLRGGFQSIPLTVGHHVPCHVKAMGPDIAGPRLLGLIPQLKVHVIDLGCSGMAGTFGLKRNQHTTSLLAGERVLREFSHPRFHFGSTECSSCRIQLEDAGEKRTLHPVQYLALAYGLLPEMRSRLEEPIQEASL